MRSTFVNQKHLTLVKHIFIHYNIPSMLW